MTASGKVLVSMLDDSMRGQFLAADKNYTSMSRSERQELSTAILQIRKTRHYLSASTRRAGIDIACAVGNSEIDVTAALGVPIMPGGPNEGKGKTLIASVQKCADQITATLGLCKR